MKFITVLLVITAIAFGQFPDTFLGSLAVGNNPADVCVSPDGSRAYAAVEWGFAAAVDINGYSTFELAGLVNIDGEPSVLECDGEGEYLYVADSENSVVHVINTTALTIEDSFDIEPYPQDMVCCPEQNSIYLSHHGGMITVIDTELREKSDLFWAGDELNSMVLSPDGSALYASDGGSPFESVIATETGAVTRVTSGMDSDCCAVSASGDKLFLSSSTWGILGVMNTESFNVDTTITFQYDPPSRMACLPDLPYLYCMISGSDILSVYRTDDLSHMGTVEVSGEPVSMAVHPDGERLFFVCAADNKMKVYGFDPAGIHSGGVSESLLVLDSPAVTPVIEVACSHGGTAVLRCHDIAGRLVQTQNLQLQNGQSMECQLMNLPQGVILVSVETAQGLLTERVVVLQP